MEIAKVKRGYLANEVSGLKPLRDTVLVSDMNFETRITTSGIIIPGDDAKNSGIRPRWGKVFAVGSDQKEIQVGHWILVAHGRWTRGITVDIDGVRHTIRRVDNKDIILSSDAPVTDDTMGDKVI
jgi:co-chaperonin GroES (HSP10)